MTRFGLALVLPLVVALLDTGSSRAHPAGTCPAARCVCADVWLRRDSLSVATRQLGAADAVVLATVERHDVLPAVPGSPAALADQSGPVIARLHVHRRWKGPQTDTLSVAFHPAATVITTCDIPLVVGRTYLVFAARESRIVRGGYEGLLATGQCTGPREASATNAMLPVLDRAAASPP